MPKLTDFKIDVTRAERGEWYDFHTGKQDPTRAHPDHLYLLIGSTSSPAYRAEVRKVLRGRRSGRFADDEELANELAGKHLLLGWDNVEDEDGNPEVYSIERSIEIMSDAQYTSIQTFVMQIAGDDAAFLEKTEKESRGNSSPVSAGSSD